jgi:hypothetical protein
MSSGWENAHYVDAISGGTRWEEGELRVKKGPRDAQALD